MPEATTTRLPRAVTALAAICVAVCGCGTSPPPAPPPPPPPIDEHLANLVPAGAQLVLWIDLEQLRASPLWDVVALAVDDREYDEIRRATGVDPLEAVDEVLIAATQKPNGEDLFVAVLKGRFDGPAAMTALVEAGNGRAIEREGLTGVVGEKMLMFAVTERTVVVCTGNAEDAVTDLANRRGKPLTADPRFEDLPIGDAAAVMRFRRGAVAPDLSRFRARAPIGDIEKITELDASLRVDTGVEVSWSFTVEDKLAASSTVRELRRLLDDLSRNPFVLLIGFDWLFDRVQVNSEGTRVDVLIVLDDRDVEQLRRLAERLRRIREMGEPGEGELERNPRIELPGLKRPLRITPKRRRGEEPAPTPERDR